MKRLALASEYLSKLPTSVPDGKWLWHNHVRPSRRQGERGARFYLANAGKQNLVPCDCEWAPELGTHYRVERS